MSAIHEAWKEREAEGLAHKLVKHLQKKTDDGLDWLGYEINGADTNGMGGDVDITVDWELLEKEIDEFTKEFKK